MSQLALVLWDKAQEALHAARHDLAVSAEAATSRAYYSAFYAVSAHFALQGRTFKKHSTLEVAVHRDPACGPRTLAKASLALSSSAIRETTAPLNA